MKPPTRSVAELLADGRVIPAHPLALTSERKLDERRQRALSRYYISAGAGGLAVGVHTTQFAIREPKTGLLRPVLELAADAMEATTGEFARIAGAAGGSRQAVAEAELAASLGYQAVLLSPTGTGAMDESELLARAKQVGEVLPVIGFYLQDAVGGRYLSTGFWSRLADLPCVVAIKIAAFDRYRTLDVLRGVAASDRSDAVALYTGNDDSILVDLLSTFLVQRPSRVARLRMVGGLLGQWAIWTHAAVQLQREVKEALEGNDRILRSLLEKAPQLTDANGAVFDAAHDFKGCIAGVNHVLAQQGLLEGPWCLEPAETLSPGQCEEIERVRRAYPWLLDDDLVASQLDDWLR
jgi:dihydrodipicolinate synthase/N-acetylneuraminate lyase